MNTLRDVSQAVVEALQERRIGSCQSVRLVCHTIADHGRMHDSLGEALDAVCDWIGESPERLAARGAAETGQITALLHFASGRTALVSVGTAGEGGATLEVVVIGSDGILAWEPESGAVADDPPPAAAVSSERARRLLRAVEHALISGQAVAGDGSEPDPSKRTLSPKDVSSPPLDPPLRRAVHRASATEPPYGVLLIAGAHTHQENYAKALGADARCRVVAVSDEPDVPPRRAALNDQLARALEIPLIPRLDDALARDDIQVVSVCAEPFRRGRIIVKCAQAGKHLYLDKPMTASIEEADAVVRAVEAAGVVSQMFSIVHTGPARRARRVVESGGLGQIVAVHCDLFFAKGPSGTANLDKRRLETERPTTFELVDSKRELFNVGVYPLVLIHWLLGRRVRSLFAVTANYFFREHQMNNMEDYGELLAELDGGVTATIAVGRTGWRSSPMGGVNRVYLIGTKRTAVIDAYRPRVAVWANESPWQPPPRHPADPMGMWSSTQEELATPAKRAWIVPGETGNDDARHFVDCVQSGRGSDVSAVEAALAVETLMAAYVSAATGRVVGLPMPRR